MGGSAKAEALALPDRGRHEGSPPRERHTLLSADSASGGSRQPSAGGAAVVELLRFPRPSNGKKYATDRDASAKREPVKALA